MYRGGMGNTSVVDPEWYILDPEHTSCPVLRNRNCNFNRVGIKKPTQKNPPKKTQKNPPKKTH
jgi:hypothetical protein